LLEEPMKAHFNIKNREKEGTMKAAMVCRGGYVG
jgi:hypothetical protein